MGRIAEMDGSIINKQELKDAHNALHSMNTEVSNHYYGPETFVDSFVLTGASDSHILMEAGPGTMKTDLAVGLAQMLGGTSNRTQGTPDLQPPDLSGARIWRADKGEFEFITGPMFADVFHVDEVGRLQEKTMSALLEAMEEGHVTEFGTRHDLPADFKVIATTNPASRNQGTIALPEAVIDRFGFGLYMPEPSWEDKGKAWTREAKHPDFAYIPDLSGVKNTAERVGYSSKEVTAAIEKFERALGQLSIEGIITPDSYKVIRNSARAGRTVIELAGVSALYHERTNLAPADVQVAFNNVYAHRIALTQAARGEQKLDRQAVLEMAADQAKKIEL